MLWAVGCGRSEDLVYDVFYGGGDRRSGIVFLLWGVMAGDICVVMKKLRVC